MKRGESTSTLPCGRTTSQADAPKLSSEQYPRSKMPDSGWISLGYSRPGRRRRETVPIDDVGHAWAASHASSSSVPSGWRCTTDAS